MLESLFRDLRYATREFRRSRGGFTIAVLAMALGIGGVTAVFSVVDRLMFRPLPYIAPDRLVWIGMKAPIAPDEFLLETDYGLLRDNSAAFESIAAMSRTNDCDLNESEPLRLACTQATHGLLPLLGVEPLIGRHFTPEEDRRGGSRAAMLSYEFWRSRFGGDPAAVGSVIKIDGQPVRIVGVLPPDFEQPNLASADVLLTWQLNIAPGVQSSFLFVFGRLKAGLSPAGARAQLEPLFRKMLQGVPPGFRKEVSFHVTGMQERQIRDYRSASWLLLACVTGLLLIACANVANLLLARSALRQEEFAIRAALGAARSRILRQSLTESVLLASAGAAAGCAFASMMLRVLKAWAPAGATRIQDAGLDARVLGFALGLTFLSALVFGMAPALRAASMTTLLGGRSVGRGWRIWQSLVAVQIGLSVVLLTGAALLLQSVRRMQQVPLGFNLDQAYAVRIQLGAERYGTPEKTAAFFEQALQRLSGVPGTRVAALSDSVPLYGGMATMVYSAIDVEGRPVDRQRPTGGMVVHRSVTPDYFAALGVPIVRGRGFTHEDRLGSEEMSIIDEVLARRLFGEADPVGQRIRTGQGSPWRTIVGVARRAKNAGLAQADDPEYYSLWRAKPSRTIRRAHVLIRSDASSAELASFIRAEVGRIDLTVPVTVTALDGNLARLTERPRLQTRLLGGFAAIGLLLAGIGQLGLISYVVTQRTAEIGIRMALGASPSDIARSVASRVGLWTAAGAVCGLVASAWLARFVQPLLFGVSPGDPATAAAVIALLGLVSAAAAFPPTLRAVRIQPASALRHE